MTKRLVLALILVVSLLLFTGCNRSVFDTTYSFDYAIIGLPDGEFIEGEVQSWLDFEDGDQIQVKIDGVTYLTHITNVVLMRGDVDYE